jgi:hypothetical protein
MVTDTANTSTLRASHRGAAALHLDSRRAVGTAEPPAAALHLLTPPSNPNPSSRVRDAARVTQALAPHPADGRRSLARESTRLRSTRGGRR